MSTEFEDIPNYVTFVDYLRISHNTFYVDCIKTHDNMYGDWKNSLEFDQYFLCKKYYEMYNKKMRIEKIKEKNKMIRERNKVIRDKNEKIRAKKINKVNNLFNRKTQQKLKIMYHNMGIKDYASDSDSSE